MGVDLSAEGRPQIFEQPVADGNWTSAAIPNPYIQVDPDAVISSISCSSASACAAGGITITTGLSSLVLYSMDDGAWSATLAPLPAGASPYPPAVDCAPDGSGCVADDTYVIDIDAVDYVQGVVSTLTNGSWATVAAPVPSNAGTDPTSRSPGRPARPCPLASSSACTSPTPFRLLRLPS